MRFTEHQYDQAIAALQDAKKQLIADGNCCSICEDSGHYSHECGHNPLVAVAMCNEIADSSEILHEILHSLAAQRSG